MGGTIFWGIRLRDREYRMNRWTNIFPQATTDDGFLLAHPSAIQHAIEPWLEMQRDWQANHATGTFANSMTPMYGPYPALFVPKEYGFIFTDFITKTIVSCQSYTDIGRLLIYPEFLTPECLEVPQLSKGCSIIFDAFEKAVAAGHTVDQDVCKLILELKANAKPPTNIYGQPLIDDYRALKVYYEEGRITHYRNGMKWIPLDSKMSLHDILLLARATGVWKSGDLFIKPVADWKTISFSAFSKRERSEAFQTVMDLKVYLDKEEKQLFEHWVEHG